MYSDQRFEINEVVWAKVIGCKQQYNFRSMVASTNCIMHKERKQSKVPCEFHWRCVPVMFASNHSADLRFEQIKKWDQKPQQQESKKLRAAIEMANGLPTGKSITNEQSIEQLNEHALKNIVIKLHDQLNKESEQVCKTLMQIENSLNSIESAELLAIVKLNFGQQLFQIHQMIKSKQDYKILLSQFIESLIGAIGYQSKKCRLRPFSSSEETLEEITKCVILQNDIKKKKQAELNQ